MNPITSPTVPTVHDSGDGAAAGGPVPLAEASFTALQRAPSRDALRRLCAEIAPGARVAAVRRLRGGLAGGMHRLDILCDDGTPLRLVLRRYTAGHLDAVPAAPRREWRTLGLVARAALAAPRPVWLDEDGALLGVPALAMTYLPGRPLLAPRDARSWTRQLAQALAAIHACSGDAQDLSFLPLQGCEQTAALLEQPSSAPYVAQRIAAHPRGAAIWEALRRWWPRLPAEPPVLLHGCACRIPRRG